MELRSRRQRSLYTAGDTFAVWAISPDQTIGIAEASLPAVTGDVTYYAAFSPTLRSYTITFNSNGGSTVSSQTVDYDTTAAEPDAPAKTGHSFACWCIDSGLTSAYDFSTPVADDITLYAKWTPNTYTLFFDAQGGDSTESSRIVTYKEPVGVLPVASKAGHTLAGWYTGENGSGMEYTAYPECGRTQ